MLPRALNKRRRRNKVTRHISPPSTEARALAATQRKPVSAALLFTIWQAFTTI